MLVRRGLQTDIQGVRHEPWPFRRSDALFVVAVVLVALPAQGGEWSLAIPPAVKLGFAAAVVSVWIRFRVFGSSDRDTR